MIFAKPPSGFLIAYSPKGRQQIDDIITNNPALAFNWRDICERIKHTGHRDGSRVTITGDANVWMLYVDIFELPDLQIVYSILGDTLTIRAVRAL